MIGNKAGGLAKSRMSKVSRCARGTNGMHHYIGQVHTRTMRSAKQRLKTMDAESNRFKKSIAASQNHLRDMQSDRRALVAAASRNNAGISLGLWDPNGEMNKRNIQNYMQSAINSEKNQLSMLRKDLHNVQGRKKRLRKRMQKANKDIHKTLMIRGSRRSPVRSPARQSVRQRRLTKRRTSKKRSTRR